MKKVIAVFLVLFIMCGNLVCFANSGENGSVNNLQSISPRFLVIAVNTNSLEVTSYDALKCVANTMVNDGYKAETIMELQIKRGDWQTIKTWTENDADWALLEKIYFPEESNKQYRLKVTHKGLDMNDNEIESSVTYSQTVQI